MQKKYAVLILMLLSLSTTAMASYLIRYHGVTQDNNKLVYGQSFTTLAAGHIRSIGIHADFGSDNLLVLHLYAGESTAEPLYTQNIVYTLDPWGWADYTFTLDTPFLVAANTQYTFTITASKPYSVHRTFSSSGYSGGQAFWSGSFISNHDIDFDIWVANYAISGTLTDASGPISGATLTFSHDSGTTTTNGSGFYTYTVIGGTSTTVTPSHPGYDNWNPENYPLENINSDQGGKNFSATLKTFTISGMVTDGINGLGNAAVVFSPSNDTVWTNVAGEYSKRFNWGTTTTWAPWHEGYHGWSPPNRSVTGLSADQSAQNFSGIINMYMISGTVSDGASPVSGASIHFSHNGHTETTGASGNYSYSIPYNTATTITPSHPGYSIWNPGQIVLAGIKSDLPDQDFNSQPVVFTVALQFKDEAGGAAVGGVICRLQIPGLSAWKVESTPQMNLLYGQFPCNALFHNSDMAPGGDYTIAFTPPAGWKFVGDSSLTLQVPPAIDYYSVSGNVFLLKYVGTTPVDEDSTGDESDENRHPLLFVKGSPAHSSEPWSNAVDEDTEGWDGTATVTADSSNQVWAIFRFPENATCKFNYFGLQTDNGILDEVYVERQTSRIEILVSTTGTEPDGFSSIGVWPVQSPEWTYYKINREVVARYVMIRLLAPVVYHHEWLQLVEFGVSWNKVSTAIPVSANSAIDVALVDKLMLAPGFPNPFNPKTMIRYYLPEAANLQLSIYNLSGQKVAQLVNGPMTAGAHSMVWNAGEMPSGVYLVRLTIGAENFTQRLTLVK